MYRPRIIPVLLLKNGGLVKTKCFKNERYIGDPINAVQIFNALKADEILLLDISAGRNGKVIDLDLVRKVGEEAFMPFSVGGGIHTLEQIAERIALGSEKVILNSIIYNDPDFVKKAAKQFGSSTLVGCMDIKKNIFGKYTLVTEGGRKKVKGDIVDWAKKLEEAGIGEIIIQSVDNDGMMLGYDIALVQMIASKVHVPVTVLGGAASLESMKELFDAVKVNGLAAGSMFVFHGPRKGILVNYPLRTTINQLFNIQ